MTPKLILLGALVCLALVTRSSAQCLCASKGLDFCSCGAEPHQRPVPKVVPRVPDIKFPPIGDSCSCGKKLVEPAIPPKPSCKDTSPPCKCNCKCSSTPIATYLDHVVPQAPVKAVRPPGVPADPLSISMALTAAKCYDVPEGKLNYGAATVPVNAVRKIYVSDIPEEKLYGLNAQIIEMKKKFPTPTKAELLAEALEDAEEEAEAVAHAPSYLTYSDIGYGPALIKSPLFMRMKGGHSGSVSLVGSKPIHKDCDYVPGKIIHAPEYIEVPAAREPPCV